jgi:hypothetical protein
VPRLTIQQTNFTAGEISPRLYGRVDIDRYGNSAKKLLNALPVIHGGARRRPGTRFVNPAKSSAAASRLIPFVFNRDTAYMLEFGESTMRVYSVGGSNLLADIATPYSSAMLADVDFVQGADTMFLFHPLVPIKRLRRFSPTSWDLSDAPFLTTPFDEQGHALAANLTLSAVSGAGQTATAGAGVFLPSDVGRRLISGAGQATVVGYTSATVITVDITLTFPGTALASGAWYLDVSPQAFAIPTVKDPVGATVSIAGAATRAAVMTLSAKTGAITVNASAAVFSAGDVGKTIYADSGVAKITAFTSGVQVSATTSSDFVSTIYQAGGWGVGQVAGGNTWRAEDVGKFLRINGGLVKITLFVNDGEVRGTIIQAMTSVVASAPLAWSLEAAVWSFSNGYPRTGTLHEQRLVVAGTTKYPQTIWGSVTGSYLDFTLGTGDSDAFSFTIASDEINPISYVASLRNLIVHTYGGEFSLQGGIEKPITPTNVRIRPESPHGSKGVRPELIGKESVFVQRAGRKVRALGYRADSDGYSAPDLSVLAEHITKSGVTALSYQQEPDLTLWAVRADGVLLSCTIDRDQSVIGWAQHLTEGAFESVATIPNGSADETWVIVRRLVNGATVRYLEVLDSTMTPFPPTSFDPAAYPPVATDVIYGCTMDAAVSITNLFPIDTISVGHLKGKTVDILADGLVQPQQVVPASGSITLERPALRIIAGLHFETQIGLLTPETGTGTGTAQGNAMRTSEISVRFLDTIGAKVYDGEGDLIDELSFRQFGEGVLDAAPQLFSGLKRTSALGWNRGSAELTIVQAQPLPMHVLSVIRKFTVND